MDDEPCNCANCQIDLYGRRFVVRGDQNLCIECYTNVFASKCCVCNEPISVGQKDLTFRGKHYHEPCFNCAGCTKSLVNEAFYSRDENVLCAECLDKTVGESCAACKNLFKNAQKRIEYRGQDYHPECFVCSGCTKPFGGESFFNKENEGLFCHACHQERYVSKCAKCQGALTDGGLSYRDQSYHRECFVCSVCTGSLAGKRFTVVDETPICSDCYKTHHAKPCFSCTSPILNQMGKPTKYITFEERYWHHECFNCTGCNSSLVGKGFVTAPRSAPQDEQKVYCPPCGRQVTAR